jgi:hypothetical protein
MGRTVKRREGYPASNRRHRIVPRGTQAQSQDGDPVTAIGSAPRDVELIELQQRRGRRPRRQDAVSPRDPERAQLQQNPPQALSGVAVKAAASAVVLNSAGTPAKKCLQIADIELPLVEEAAFGQGGYRQKHFVFLVAHTVSVTGLIKNPDTVEFVARVSVRFLYFGREQLPARPAHDPDIPSIPARHIDLARPSQPFCQKTRAQDWPSHSPLRGEGRPGRTGEITRDTHGAGGADDKTES